jgi:hypothetical protein
MYCALCETCGSPGVKDVVVGSDAVQTLSYSKKHTVSIFNLKDGGSVFFWNVGIHLKFQIEITFYIIFQLNQLELEGRNILLVEEENKKHLETYKEVSAALHKKLCHVWLLENQVRSVNQCKTPQAYDFLKRLEDWSIKYDVIVQDMTSVHFNSCTTSSRYSYTVL